MSHQHFGQLSHALLTLMAALAALAALAAKLDVRLMALTQRTPSGAHRPLPLRSCRLRHGCRLKAVASSRALPGKSADVSCSHDDALATAPLLEHVRQRAYAAAAPLSDAVLEAVTRWYARLPGLIPR